MDNRPQTGGAPDPKVMKKIGLGMNILMGVTMSFCLSLVGNLMSPNFAIPAFLSSFLISTVISIILGFLVPMKKVGDAVVRAAKLRPGTIGARCLESFISDLIYTPILTVSMVSFAYFMSGGNMPFVPTLLKSLLVSMVVGFVLIFIFMPLYLRLMMKINGIAPPPSGAGAPPDHE